MSDIKMIVTMCCVENVPIEDSHFYRLVLEDHGQEVADFFTEDIEMPLENAEAWRYDDIMRTGSDELVDIVLAATGGVAPGGRADISVAS